MAAAQPAPLLVNSSTLKQPAWGKLHGSASALAIAEASRAHDGLLLVISPDMKTAQSLQESLRFFLAESCPTLVYPDWETLPYDHFSPHREIVSQRLETLYRLPQLQQGILIAPVATVMQRLLPIEHLNSHSLLLKVGETINLDQMRLRLEKSGYRCVTQVMEQGEFSVRGSLLDLFPMARKSPYRIDLFDDEIDTIRTFNPEDQRSLDQVEQIHLLPAREFPLDEAAIKRFRTRFRETFDVVANDSPIYRDVSNGIAPAGIEYYQPLFFEQLSQLNDYLPDNTLSLALDGCQSAAELFWQQLESRFEQRRHDSERPLLAPEQLFLPSSELEKVLANSLSLQSFKQEQGHNFASELPPKLMIDSHQENPLAALKTFLDQFDGKVLLLAESAGRREALLELLRDNQLTPKQSKSWPWFLNAKSKLYLGEATLEEGLHLPQAGISVIVESQLLGERVRQNRRRSRPTRDADAVIANLTDLHLGAPVVHIDHGVGRYSGMVTLEVGGLETEFLLLEYAKNDKLYVPVSALNLISRYSGSNPDNAPLHRLGGEQWQRLKRKAAEKVHDVAAELLEIHAQRAARGGHGFKINPLEQATFAEAFPFEETPDQLAAINAVQADMTQSQSMDRVVCGDVGFGKTEVAMRAAFTAANGGRQVAVLVPTTLLAQQHQQNFLDRFADWPFRIESLSRFRSKKEQDESLKALAEGKVDIIIGTHKLLQKSIKFKNLGLVIIDEEHRFGVRHKEQLKTMRAEVDILTLTATPIPRTLNMSLAGMRDLSIIATAPAHRHAIKTFVSQWQDELIEEACRRELARGGQIYFLHNEVKTIDLIASQIEAILPEAQIRVAHGQMREQELEQVTLDFYHQRFNILVCTTIIESGIDIPTANTIIINRADKLGLAQLHQLRGRVGRSHHRAYAYLFTPPKKLMTSDAQKRLSAIEALEELGVGFTLASHDLEIRGAGELLGDGQSGQIQEIGFTLYQELLARAVKALKEGKHLSLDQPLEAESEVDLHLPALLPSDYVVDVHNRLILYKRIASAADKSELRELQVELIDRFGLLPEQTKNLFRLSELKLRVKSLGIQKLDANAHGGRLLMDDQADIDIGHVIQLIQLLPNVYRFEPPHVLRFSAELQEVETRFDFIDKLLEKIRKTP